MKGLIYLGLILIFIMFFNTNPMIALMVLGCILGVFLFMRRKKSKVPGRLSSGLFSGLFGLRKGSSQHQSSFNAVLTLMILQQMGISEEEKIPIKQNVRKEDKRKEEIERQKQETLKLLKNGEEL